MKYKNVEDLTKSYYPSEQEMERYALGKLIDSICGKDSTVITNALFRGGISSISQLYNISIDELKKIRTVGDKRLDVIIEIKKFITHLIDES